MIDNYIEFIRWLLENKRSSILWLFDVNESLTSFITYNNTIFIFIMITIKRTRRRIQFDDFSQKS